MMLAEYTPVFQPILAAQALIQLVIAVGLSLLAGYLLQQKNKSVVRDDKPTTLATRGSFVSWVFGLRRIGPVFCWAGNRDIRKEKAAGGKGFGGSPKVDAYYEDGFHCLAVGPMFCLHRILENGKPIFEGPISSDSHPSGTLVDLGSVGQFSIYWGEERQPENTYLGDSSRVGVSSRWPFMCYIEWRQKRLGGQPAWPLLDYVVERRPRAIPLLNDTVGYVEPTRTLDGPSVAIFAVDTVDDEITVDGHVASDFKPKSIMRLAGNALADQDLEVLIVTEFYIPGAPFHAPIPQTLITTVEDLTGMDTAGTLQAYTQLQDDGINAAHGIAELLFQEWPEGLGEAQSAWDMPSLEALGTLTETEDLQTSWLGQEGETGESILAGALQDLGVLIPLDVETGLLRFIPIREPSGLLPDISADLQPKLPEVESRLGAAPADKLVFGFPDRDIQFRDMTIAVDNDGQATQVDHQSARQVPITTVVNFATGALMAERRSQEEMAHPAKLKLDSTRATRKLLPGQAVTVAGLLDVMRVATVQLDPLTSRVKLGLLSDFYGAQSNFIAGVAGVNSDILLVSGDIQFTIVEVPEVLLNSEPQTIIVPRIRAHNQIVSSAIHLSGDNVTYFFQATDTSTQTGGTLIDPLPAEGEYVIENGPTFTAKGPDIASVLDLSSDQTNWKLGRQLCVMGTEIFFLRNITAIGGDVYRLDGLIRARYDSRQAAHLLDHEVFIFANDEFLSLQDVLLQPNTAIFAKSQPQAGGVLPISLVNPETETLCGKGVIPVAPSKPYTANGCDCYATGAAVELKWAYSVPRSAAAGAGLQGAGNAISVVLPEGDFELEILTTLDVVVRTVNTGTPSYTYTNVNLVADLGGEVNFKVRVKQLRDGFASKDSPTLTVEKI